MTGYVARFGQVEFDAARGRLAVAGRPVKLDRSCAAVLSALLSEAGKDVCKNRLLEAGWPGRVVHENSLAKAIVRLRQALGEDGGALETVHGYGYRLAVDPEFAIQPERQERRPDSHRRPAFAVVGLGAAAAVVLALAASTADTQGSTESNLMRGEPADAIGRLLWVDDHPENNAEERRFLERRKIAVYQVTTTDDALALLAMYEYGAVISDMNRNGKPLDGLELVREMRQRGDETPFVIYSIVPSVAQWTLVSESGGQGATVTPEELYAAVLPIFGENGPGRLR